MRGPLRSAVVAGVFAFCALQSGCRAAAPWPLWEAYTARFMDPQGRIVDYNSQNRTTTEGQAYAMFFALVAGDRPRFDKLLHWTQNNLAQGDLTARLPAWSWGKGEDGTWRVLDVHPAADADLWMAYTLCEAGRLWRFQQYDKLGSSIAARVAQQEVVLVPGLGTTLLPGAQGFHPDQQTWFVNPSYLPPQLLAYFAKRDPLSPWREVAASLPDLEQSPGGFVMDWVRVGPGGVQASVNPSKLANGPSTEAPVGSYDAIRSYLWAGMAEQGTDGLKEALAPMGGMASYMRSHRLPPQVVDATGRSTAGDGPVGFSAALIPYLEVLGMNSEAKTQMERVAAEKDQKTGLYGRDPAYYDQNLVLFALGWKEQRFGFEADGRLRLKWK